MISKFFVTLALLSSVAASAANPISACAGLDGTIFKSINKYEAGLTPTGVAYEKWTVSFHGDNVFYSHSDIGGSDKFNCSGQEGEISTPLLQNGVGYYFAAKQVLLWDGKWYEKSSRDFPEDLDIIIY